MKTPIDPQFPNFNDLEYFLVISQTKSFSKASEVLNLAQSTLSMAIKKLEKSLKSKLFIRSSKGVSLTPSGKIFELKAKTILQNWRDASNTLHDTNSLIQGRYSLGMNMELGIKILPKSLPTLLSQNNHLEIDLIYDSSLKIEQKVIDAQLDVGVIVDGKHHPDLIAKKIYTGYLALWISSESNPTDINLDYQNGSAILLYNPLMSQARRILRSLEDLGIKYSRTLTCPNNVILEELAHHRAGIAIGPDWLFHNKLEILPIENLPQISYDLYAIYRVENKNNASIQRMVASITHSLL